MINVNRRKGFKIWEMALFMFFLAIAAGASVFFFFLSSQDVRTAQAKSSWKRSINNLLDRICEELKNAGQIEHPFQGSSKECLFRRSVPGGMLEASLEIEGFLFSDGTLSHIVRTASSSNILKPFYEVANPLVTRIHSFRFERSTSRLLKIIMKIAPPGSQDSYETIERSICLRNL